MRVDQYGNLPYVLSNKSHIYYLFHVEVEKNVFKVDFLVILRFDRPRISSNMDSDSFQYRLAFEGLLNFFYIFFYKSFEEIYI